MATDEKYFNGKNFPIYGIKICQLTLSHAKHGGIVHTGGAFEVSTSSIQVHKIS